MSAVDGGLATFEADAHGPARARARTLVAAAWKFRVWFGKGDTETHFDRTQAGAADAGWRAGGFARARADAPAHALAILPAIHR